mgnify:CR=1 FL=1
MAKAKIIGATFTEDNIDNDGEPIRLKFDRCPVRWVPPSVWGFARILRYHGEFPGAVMPGIDRVPRRFLRAYNIYVTARADAEQEVKRYGK